MDKFNPVAYTTRLCLTLNLLPQDVTKILNMFNEISRHPHWSSVRSNRGLLVDCAYIHCINIGKNISVEKMKSITKKEFGAGTQPRPNKWRGGYGLQSIIKPL